MFWKTARRTIALDRPLVMGILNVTPDSFSDGGKYSNADLALKRAGEMIAEGVDIIDIGGESTRPGSLRVDAETECSRVIPAIELIARHFDMPISIDTSKSEVAGAALAAGAEIVNDISGLRWDREIAKVAAESGAGLVLMHSRGSFETMHSEPPVKDVIAEVVDGLRRSVRVASDFGVTDDQIVLDVGIGFGKTPEQNFELIAKVDRIRKALSDFPLLVGASRKSFIGKILDVGPPERMAGSLAVHMIAMWNGASIIRSHDVRESVQIAKIAKDLLHAAN